MCDLCGHIEETVLLSTVEEEVIMLEADSGESVDHAVRALLPHERAAKVRFGDIQTLLDTAVDTWAAHLDDLWAALRRILEGLPSAAPDMLRQLDAWVKAPPPGVVAALDEARAAGARVLEQTARDAVDLVNAEAARQGVEREAAPAPPAQAILLPVAGLAGAFLWDAVTTRLQRSVTPAMLMGREPLDLPKILDAHPLDGVKDQARQAVHTAHGAGRVAAQRELDPVTVWASEILDGRTCERCARIDGHEFDSMDEAMAAYPGGGGYVGCLGGGRCRGTLVVLYRQD